MQSAVHGRAGAIEYGKSFADATQRALIHATWGPLGSLSSNWASKALAYKMSLRAILDSTST